MNQVNKIVIKSSEGSEQFEIGPRDGDYLDLNYKGKALQASTKIYLYEDDISLRKLFEEISQNWKGWQGAKSWTSLEEDLMISCSSDTFGHVTISLEITNRMVEPGWVVKTDIRVDSGDLENIARQARTFLCT